ncbi:MAG: threonylcarbamoyl-AMP synthase [Phycisphaeraceae bacterium]|nr:threonylcarbamoyl-AMP synthase [Phycisphaeraceae bacterium]
MSAGPEQIAHAVARLRAGGLVAFPTETVYGLGAIATDRSAVVRVFALKGRPQNNPLIVHVAGEDMARSVAGAWPARAHRLADSFWPGPVSIVVPRAEAIPSLVAAGADTIAIRCPAHPLTLALIEALGAPLVGPSANPSGAVSPTTADHVRAAFQESEVYVLDGGPCRRGIESTVVSVLSDPPRILRPGVIGADELADTLGEPVEDARGHGHEAPSPAPSPGLLQRHYAPRAPMRIVEREHLADAPAGAVLLAHSPGPFPSALRVIEMPADAPSYAARLYAAMREADGFNPPRILVERPPLPGSAHRDAAIWRAIADRLTRAATPASGDA